MLVFTFHEVGGKVILLLSCVILFTRCLCMMSLPVWLPGPMFLLGDSLYLVPCSFQEGVSVSNPMLIPETPTGQRSPWTETSWTKTCRQRPNLDRDPQRQFPQQRPLWTETPLDREPPLLDREPPLLDRDPRAKTPRMVKSGRYTSYKNAFLLSSVNSSTTNKIAFQ